MSKNTGKFIFTTLREIDSKTGKPTGRVKSNSINANHYVPPITDVIKCPLLPVIFNFIFEVSINNISKGISIEGLFPDFGKVGKIDWGDRDEDYNPINVKHTYSKSGTFVISIFALDVEKIFSSRVSEIIRIIQKPQDVIVG